jgi:hypothetical protein
MNCQEENGSGYIPGFGIAHEGDQFQILDPANLPQEPSIPNKKKIFALAFLMAGFLGFGGAIGLEKIDLSLRGVTDFKHFFDIPILASIPILETRNCRQKKLRLELVIFGVQSWQRFKLSERQKVKRSLFP